jgi:GntR family transcriptional repressor for pyruvate dehydrogenase complex
VIRVVERASSSAGSSQSGVNFEPIEPLRAHEYVAEQIRRHIGLGLIGAGQSLPPERELAKMFGVARATIQAALRLLEADRLIVSRRGRGGGTFVVEPLEDDAERERSRLEIRLSREQIEDALRYRRVVEEGAARFAAERPSPEDVAKLRVINEQMANSETEREFHRLDTEFHVGIAIASHSDLLKTGIEQSRLLLNDAIFAQPETDVWHDRICREHNSIIGAIENGDPKRAVRVMRNHLAHTEKGVGALITALG